MICCVYSLLIAVILHLVVQSFDFCNVLLLLYILMGLEPVIQYCDLISSPFSRDAAM